MLAGPARNFRMARDWGGRHFHTLSSYELDGNRTPARSSPSHPEKVRGEEASRGINMIRCTAFNRRGPFKGMAAAWTPNLHSPVEACAPQAQQMSVFQAGAIRFCRESLRGHGLTTIH